MKSVLHSTALRPILGIGLASIRLRSKSVKNRDRPSVGFFASALGVVRAMIRILFARWAEVVQIFRPEMR